MNGRSEPSEPSEPIVRFAHASCSYGGPAVVEGVDLMIGSGEFVGIVGPSGSGKTTLLRAITGSIEVGFGTLWIRRGLRIGYVPQVESVDWSFPVTVGEVIGMTRIGRWRWPRTTSAERQATTDLLDRLGLDGLFDRHIREMSVGQQQRVFLARALAQAPDLLVLDEPTSGVDVRTRHEILHLLAEINAGGVSIILTTHDLNGLAAHLPRLVCFNRTVIADGAPSAVLRTYFLERTFGAPMQVLEHGGMPVVVDQPMSTSTARMAKKPT